MRKRLRMSTMIKAFEIHCWQRRQPQKEQLTRLTVTKLLIQKLPGDLVLRRSRHRRHALCPLATMSHHLHRHPMPRPSKEQPQHYLETRRQSRPQSAIRAWLDQSDVESVWVAPEHDGNI